MNMRSAVNNIICDLHSAGATFIAVLAVSKLWLIPRRPRTSEQQQQQQLFENIAI